MMGSTDLQIAYCCCYCLRTPRLVQQRPMLVLFKRRRIAIQWLAPGVQAGSSAYYISTFMTARAAFSPQSYREGYAYH